MLYCVRVLRFAPLMLLLAWTLSAGPAKASEAAWALLKQPGHVVLMRHANAPGIGEDPPGIDLKNCALQRNLDERGRAQARAIGEEFRRRGFKQVRMVSSQFCRAIDTAKLMGFGSVQQLPALNYVNFEDPQLDAIMARTIAYIKTIPPKQPAVLVTHISNVKALTLVTPSSGEMVVVRLGADGKLGVAGRIAPP